MLELGVFCHLVCLLLTTEVWLSDSVYAMAVSFHQSPSITIGPRIGDPILQRESVSSNCVCNLG